MLAPKINRMLVVIAVFMQTAGKQQKKKVQTAKLLEIVLNTELSGPLSRDNSCVSVAVSVHQHPEKVQPEHTKLCLRKLRETRHLTDILVLDILLKYKTQSQKKKLFLSPANLN